MIKSNMSDAVAAAVRVKYVATRGAQLPKKQWLAQISSGGGAIVETLGGEYLTEELALGAARREIAGRTKDATSGRARAKEYR